MSLEFEIKAPKNRPFRRLFIKRKDEVTGLFESDWQDITNDVKKWGKVTTRIDTARANTFKFGNTQIVMENTEGLYNPNDDPASLWFGHANQQRTLVKIEYGFYEVTSSGGIFTISETPGGGWDDDIWDADIWDGDGGDLDFIGIIAGDIFTSSKNEVALPIKPLTQIFRDYPAEEMDGFTSTGITAQKFVENLRDHTNGGHYVFRPFFGDTTSNWSIATTTINYTNLSTVTAKDIRDKTCWDVLEKLAEVEQFVPYVKNNGVMFFGPKDAPSTAAFEFHGVGSFDGKYGQTIKTIEKFGPKLTKFYAKIKLRYGEEDTSTSFQTKTAAFSVTGSNNPWNLGFRTYELENFYIPNSTTADSITTSIFNDLSSLKKEIEFTTSFVPHITALDLINVSYDGSSEVPNTRWDANDWDTELTWDDSKSDNIRLVDKEFKVLSSAIDLDKLECKYIARET